MSQTGAFMTISVSWSVRRRVLGADATRPASLMMALTVAKRGVAW
jgi:hypothetical protein